MNQVREKIAEFADEIRAEATESERLGRLSDRTSKLMRDAGVIRMLQPKSYGGFEFHPREFAETVMHLASLDGSAGWVAGVVGVHPWELAYADPRVQEEVWGEDPDTWMASPYAPMGVLTPTEDGYRFSGRWQFSSGTDHCDWLFLGAILGDETGRPAKPFTLMHVVIPRTDYEIVEDSWDVVGLRGTGSKDIIVQDAVVPDHRVLEYTKVAEGVYAKQAGIENPLYHVPFSGMFPLGITAAVIGMAEGALQVHLDYQRERVQIHGTKVKDDPYVLTAIGEAAAEIQASRAALLDNICSLYDDIVAGREISFERRAVGRRTQTQCAWRAVRAVDEIVARSGGNGLRMQHPLQRFWRDIHMGLAHAIHVPGSIFHASTLTNLDIEPPPGPMRSMI
jgi:3-hydroxy-9,10-secoandrosta-1,3,5(10)-triene-9,17-dione monooxygenase